MEVEDQLVSEFLSQHSEDAARLLEQLPAEQAIAVLGQARPEAAARCLSHMSAPLAAHCLESVEPAAARALLEALPPGSAAGLLRQIGSEKRESLLGEVSRATRERLELLLRYPENTSGAIMEPLTTTVTDDITVEQARRQLRDAAGRLYYYLYVVDRSQMLLGVVGLRELLLADGDDLISVVMTSKVISVSDRVPLNALLFHPGWRDFHALPVVSSEGQFVGMIRHNVLRRTAELEQTGRSQVGFETLFALGELYWTGLVELFGGMSSGPQRPEPR